MSDLTPYEAIKQAFDEFLKVVVFNPEIGSVTCGSLRVAAEEFLASVRVVCDARSPGAESGDYVVLFDQRQIRDDMVRCPWCGEKAMIVPIEYPVGIWYEPRCSACTGSKGARGSQPTIEKAVAAWNNRRPDSEAEELAQLRELRQAGVNYAWAIEIGPDKLTMTAAQHANWQVLRGAIGEAFAVCEAAKKLPR